ncbi:hypothetical protein ACFWNK_38145 [Streptomyces sp. NPDC058417]|uniref:hypothetical protein n=1 Tax=unclassified Streptomyces TaxID=2593676 RepID=UPI00365AAB6B
MSNAATPQDDVAPSAPPVPAAVLYVCADRGPALSALAARRARAEGLAYAQERGLAVTAVFCDPYGEPDPQARAGWTRVREMAAAREITAVLIRWPAALAPESSADLRHRETDWLREHGVRLHYTWAPLVAVAAGGPR